MQSKQPINLYQVSEELSKLAKKYEDLVWYARSPRLDNEEAWEGTPQKIIDGNIKQMMRIEEEYEDDVPKLRDEETGDWQHGFNSGMLAGVRFAWTALNLQLGDDGYYYGGLRDAIDSFPDLDC